MAQKIHSQAKFDFWQPLDVSKKNLPQNPPKVLLKIGRLADHYFSKDREYVSINKEGKRNFVKIEGYEWKTALKVISSVLTAFILPGIALIAKKLYKDYCEKNVKFNEGSEKQPPAAPKVPTPTGKNDNEIQNRNNPQTERPTPITKNPERPTEIPTQRQLTDDPTRRQPTEDAEQQDEMPEQTAQKENPEQQAEVPVQVKQNNVENIEEPIEPEEIQPPPEGSGRDINRTEPRIYTLGNTQILVKLGSITKVKADVLVNAANSELLAGAGICGAFRKDAGPDIFTECDNMKKKLNVASIPVGQTVMTTSGNIKNAKAILHTVGPKGSDKNRKELLINAIENSLKMAAGIDVNEDYVSPNLPQGQKYQSIVIPAISTGIFGYPLEEAAQITAETVKKFVEDYPDAFKEINFVFMDPEEDKKNAENHKKTAKAYLKNFDQQFTETLVHAAYAENQYTLHAEACCTYYAFSFIALNEPANPEKLQKLIEKHAIKGQGFIADDKAVGYLNDLIERYQQNPIGITAGGLTLTEEPLEKMNIDSFEVDHNEEAMKHFIKFILESFTEKDMSGCVMSNGLISVALRKFNDGIEFFDSHGPDALINNMRPAYVMRVPNLNEDEVIEKLLPYLKKLIILPQDGFAVPEAIAVYPVKLKAK